MKNGDANQLRLNGWAKLNGSGSTGDGKDLERELARIKDGGRGNCVSVWEVQNWLSLEKNLVDGEREG